MVLNNERINIDKGINLNIIKTDKFKSNLISVYLIRPLVREEATKNALLPSVLRRGTKEYTNSLEIERKLENMYGSNLGVGISKKGERHILRFSIEGPKRNYVKDEKQNVELIKMIRSIIYQPYLEEEAFSESYLKQEKENLKRKIEGRINDKRNYAIERCIEEMCKNEKFSIYELGYVEDLESIDNVNLYKHYLEVLETSEIEIFAVGEFEENEIQLLKDYNKTKRTNILEIPREKITNFNQTKNMVFEDMDISQGKLVLGYRASIPYEHELYNGLLLASGILGGSPNSKLFINVREKESLAYYIGSQIYKFKSLMIVDAGIDFKTFEKTIEIVRANLDEMKEGMFTEEDIDISKKAISSSIKSIVDSNFLISEFFLSQNLTNDYKGLEETIKEIDNTPKNQIVKAANKINIDTIYFLRNKNQ
ncbi:MAG TPA: pitrilysin family protein [Tissierellales bacterium]|nr:pitrilysin family protein [Tissierellales bacterium]